MSNCCANYFTLPDITVHINCDTPLAINLRMFDLGEQDELVFTVKNYDYIDSPYVYLFKARAEDADENGEVFFKISSETSKKLKHGAIYNFAVILNTENGTEYRRLTDNGHILLAYGAQDLGISPEADFDTDNNKSDHNITGLTD